MKKKFYLTSFVVLLAIGGYNMYQTVNNGQEASSLLLENVEALTMDENDLCPNGCVQGTGGCYCYMWYKHLKEG